MMSFLTCCVAGCFVRFGEGVPLHRFPNPQHEKDRFQSWIKRIGGELNTLETDYLYNNRRVCHKHFENVYHGSTNRLVKTAVPSLYLSGSPQTVLENVTSDNHNLTLSATAGTSTEFITNSSSHTIAGSPQIVTDNVTSDNHNLTLSAIAGTSTEFITNSSTHSIAAGVHLRLSQNQKKIKKMLLNLKRQIYRHKKVKDTFKQRLSLAKKFCKENAFALISAKLSAAAKTFIKMQIKQAGKKTKGHRYTLKEKILALSLYKASPKSYRFLSSFFILPQRKTLQGILRKFKMQEGINDTLFAELKKRVEKIPDEYKYCTIIFDEMAIMPNITYCKSTDKVFGLCNGQQFASHVLVFMVRGVIKKFKQPVAYFFTKNIKKEGLIKVIKKIIENVQNSGLKVLATVCDQGANNIAAINGLIEKTKAEYIRKEKTWKGFFFEINEKKIFPIFDPPHLIKGIRNNLLTKDLVYKKGNKLCTAKWQYILDLYNRAPGYKGVQLVNKLTAYHVIPHLIPKMKVKYSTQIFSRSVGVTLGFMAEEGKLPEESKETADLLIFFDELFDSVNGSFNKIENGKKYRTAVTPRSPHHKLWETSIPILKSMKFINKNGKCSVVPTLSSWIKTLEGIKLILKKLNRAGLNSILLRHFNQDPIENFFGAIRAQGSQNVMPSAAYFQAAYKTLMINNLTSSHSVGANCEKDGNRILLNSLKLFLNMDKETTKIKSTINEEHLIINDVNIENLINNRNAVNVEKCAALAYCSGWFLSKLKNIYKNCIICKSDFESAETENFHKIIKLREYEAKNWLCYPTKKLFNCFVQTENIAIEILKTCIEKDNLIEYVKLVYSINLDLSFLHCDVHKERNKNFLLHKSALFHIHTYIKQVNKILVGKSTNWDQNDPIKTAAAAHFEKNKKNKRLRLRQVHL